MYHFVTFENLFVKKAAAPIYVKILKTGDCKSLRLWAYKGGFSATPDQNIPRKCPFNKHSNSILNLKLLFKRQNLR